jgi:ribosomal protein S13
MARMQAWIADRQAGRDRLTYIYGIGRSRSNGILKEVGVSPTYPVKTD